MYGDTAAMRKRVMQLREQGLEVRAMADRLVAQAESVPWHGRAAEAMRSRIKDRASHLREAASFHDTAAESLDKHVHEVDRLQEAISTIERKTATLTADARTRAAAMEADGRDPSGEDTVLAQFVAPPPGHKDWLTVSLPGL
jgi:chromosome segregation ATPase